MLLQWHSFKACRIWSTIYQKNIITDYFRSCTKFCNWWENSQWLTVISLWFICHWWKCLRTKLHITASQMLSCTSGKLILLWSIQNVCSVVQHFTHCSLPWLCYMWATVYLWLSSCRLPRNYQSGDYMKGKLTLCKADNVKKEVSC